MTVQSGVGFPERIPERDLTVHGAGTRGGSSTVFAVFGYEDGVLYKKYTGPRSESGVVALVDMRSDWDAATTGFADSHFAWPLAAVISDDDDVDAHKEQVAGVLLPKATSVFWAQLSTNKVRVRDFNYLLYEARSAQVGIEPVSRRQKLELIRSLVSALAWLEDRGLVHEDLAAQNVLWTVSPSPSVMVLDCDSIHPVAGKTGDPLFVTTDWSDPRVLTGQSRRPDAASMSYAVGLLTARVFLDPNWRPSLTDPVERLGAEFPAALASVLAGAVRASAPRPPLAEWIGPLDEAIAAAPETTAEPLTAVELLGRPELRRGGMSYAAKERLVLSSGFLVGAIAAFLLVMVML